MDHQTAEDSALVGAARDGDIAAFEALVRRHTRIVYAHALRFFGDPSTAEDITQEVFVKVFRSLSTFDERSRFTTWLFRVTRNTCLDEIRSGKRRPIPMDPLDAPPIQPDFADEVALTASVEHAMRSLPPEDRDALAAIALFGLSYAEASEALGVPTGTVKSRVFRARRTLAVTLDPSTGGA